MSHYTRKTAPRAPLTPEQQALASDPVVHRRAASLIAACSRRYHPAAIDDIASEIGWRLCQAATTFDPSCGASWRAYATSSMKLAVKDAIRRAAGGKRQSPRPTFLSIDTPIDGDSGASFVDLFTDAAPPVGWEIEREDECLAVSRRAGAVGGPVMRLVLLRADAALHREAGDHLGVSESRVSQRYADAVATLRAAHESGQIDLSGLAEIGGAA